MVIIRGRSVLWEEVREESYGKSGCNANLLREQIE